MQLDRNITMPPRGKYALIKLRETMPLVVGQQGKDYFLISKSAVDFGDSPETDFFVIRLKDRYAADALRAYADAADRDGEKEYASEVRFLSGVADAGEKRKPD